MGGFGIATDVDFDFIEGREGCIDRDFFRRGRRIRFLPAVFRNDRLSRIRTTDGDRGFGHVRGQDELPHPGWGRFKRFQLLMRGQSGIQGEHLQRRITLAVQLFGHLPRAHRRGLYLLLPG